MVDGRRTGSFCRSSAALNKKHLIQAAPFGRLDQMLRTAIQGVGQSPPAGYLGGRPLSQNRKSNRIFVLNNCRFLSNGSIQKKIAEYKIQLQVPTWRCRLRSLLLYCGTHVPKIQATRNTSYLTASKSLNGRKNFEQPSSSSWHFRRRRRRGRHRCREILGNGASILFHIGNVS